MTAATTCAHRWKKAQLSHFPVDESLAGALLFSRAEQGKVTAQRLPLHRNYFAWRNRSLRGKATSDWTTLTHTCSRSSHSLILSSPKASRDVESRQHIFRFAVVIVGVFRRRLLPLFSPNSWNLWLHTTDGTYEWISAFLEGSCHRLP